MIDEKSQRAIAAYIAEARLRGWPSVDFAWGEPEERSPSLRGETLDHVHATHAGCKATNLGWGMTVVVNKPQV